MITTVIKRSTVGTAINQQGTLQLAVAFSSAKKEQLIFFSFLSFTITQITYTI